MRASRNARAVVCESRLASRQVDRAQRQIGADELQTELLCPAVAGDEQSLAPKGDGVVTARQVPRGELLRQDFDVASATEQQALGAHERALLLAGAGPALPKHYEFVITNRGQ